MMGSGAVVRQKVKNKFALRLMPSLRQGAEKISALEGVSMNQFINVAIAEKVARAEQAHWAANRIEPTEADRRESLDFIARLPDVPPMAGDEVPPEYLEWRRKQWGEETPGVESADGNRTQ